MFQAISYAGMVARWEPEDFLGRLDADRQEELVDFLEVEKGEINRRQRIILIAGAFDYSVLIGAEWLSEQFGVDVLCCLSPRTLPATPSSSSARTSSRRPSWRNRLSAEGGFGPE